MKYILFILICIFSTTIQAKLTKEQEDLIKNFSKSVPYVKNTEGFEESISLQQEFFEYNLSEFFNKSVLNYYKNNVEKFLGYSSKAELVYFIPELNKIYNDYKNAENKISRYKFQEKYKETFFNLAEKKYSQFVNKTFYSEVSVLGAYEYNLEKHEKHIIFSKTLSTPSLYFRCYKNGDMIATFIGSQIANEKAQAPSNVTKTPIVLKVSEEVKSMFYSKSEKINDEIVENLCVLKKNFSHIDIGEDYESAVNEYGRKFIAFFTIEENKNSKPYLTGKLSHLGLFKLDQADFYHFPYDLFGGYTYSEKSLDDIIEDRVNLVNKDPKYTKQFLNSKFSYTLGDFFIHGLDNNQFGLSRNGTRLYVIYDYEEKEKEIVFSLNKIKRDSPYPFPLKIRVIKNPNKSSYDLEAYTLYSNNPYEYKKEELNLKNGFYIDWANDVENLK